MIELHKLKLNCISDIKIIAILFLIFFRSISYMLIFVTPRTASTVCDEEDLYPGETNAVGRFWNLNTPAHTPSPHQHTPIHTPTHILLLDKTGSENKTK